MLEGAGSRTALGAAALRAAHQMLDGPPVFEDPLARRILGAAGEAVLEARLEHPAASARLRTVVAVRSRIAEDAVGNAVRAGVRQYVVLGAGLDTFACRNPHAAAGLQVFEVDHPATQAWKRARLAEAGIDQPKALHFVPVEFERDPLRPALQRAGFRFELPAVYAWLGVVMYLDRAAVIDTLALVASGAAPAEVVLDYIEAPSAGLSPAARTAYEAAAQRVAAIGEPWRTFFAPDELGAELRRLGFDEVEDLDGRELIERHFKGRPVVPTLAHVLRVRRTVSLRQSHIFGPGGDA